MQLNWTAGRVPPIRDCVGSPNNLAPGCPKLSAIHVTAKAIFERLYLVPGPRQFAPFVIVLMHPHSHPLTLQLISRFFCLFIKKIPELTINSCVSHLACRIYPPWLPLLLAKGMVANHNVVLILFPQVPKLYLWERKVFLSSKMMNCQPLLIQKREIVDDQKIKYNTNLLEKSWAKFFEKTLRKMNEIVHQHYGLFYPLVWGLA